jgi:hypothetical protein
MQTLERVSQVGTHASQAALIAQGFHKGLGFVKAFAHPFECGERQERAAQVEPEVDGLLQDISALGEVLQRRLDGVLWQLLLCSRQPKGDEEQ